MDRLYSVGLAASADKEIQKLPAKIVERIFPHVEGLAANPRPPGCKKLKGGDKEYRIRIGDYRVVYVIDDTARTVDITRIAHRRDVYE
ncbi:MAG: type II toxin-antitoxin system RelE/ParE family toxin [Alphaproteobacteria bacterium]